MVKKVFYFGRKRRTRAFGEYDIQTRKITVYKGSIVSESIAQFSKTNEIKELRKKYTDNKGILLQDITFDSPSAAAVFVSGYSVNGLLAWHVEEHKTLKSMLQEYDK